MVRTNSRLVDLIGHAANATLQSMQSFSELQGYALAFEVIAGTAVDPEDRKHAETWQRHMQTAYDRLVTPVAA